MFQRLSNLLFGAVEDVSTELNDPKPCVSEADEEGWLLVSVPGDSDCIMLGEDGAEVPSIAQCLPHSECQRAQSKSNIASSPTSDSVPSSCKRRRARSGRPQAAFAPSSRSLRSPLSLESSFPLGSVGANAPSDPTPCLCGPAPECSGGLDESWFITPPPCFTAEGAPAEASPMEDLLIEHPSMSVYVSSSNLEPSTANMADSVSLSRMSESMTAPVTRLAQGSACQVVPLAKVTQLSRVQRAKSRVERRHLARSSMQRQNRVRQQIPRHIAHTRNSFLHQPCQRNFCH